MNRSLRHPGGFRAALIAAAAAVALAGASKGQPLPNLTPYQAAGWSDRIVVSRTAGSKVDSSPLVPTDTLYVAWAAVNNGTAATGARFFTELYLDGSLKAAWFTDPPLSPNFYTYVEDFSIGSLPAGIHALRIKTDATNAIAEGNETDNEYTKTIVVSASGGPACAPGPSTLCLNNSRFKVQVAWRVPAQGLSGAGNAVGLTPDTGYFWFFSASNVELVVKVVDGRSFNGRFWVFYGALSDVEYTITVTDTSNGTVKTYFNPSGHLASVADTAAFTGSPGVISEPKNESRVESRESRLEDPLFGAPDHNLRPSTFNLRPADALRDTAACLANETTLCLNSGRFQAQVAWRVPAQGTSGAGMAVPLTTDTGYFWFFSSNNIELVLKVVDGRAFNNAFWVFFGALSNVEYTITVTDTLTGTVKTYVNPSGQLTSVADTAAFTTPVSSVSPLIDNLKTVSAQARMNNENFPDMIRGGATVYNSEVAALVAAGPSAVPRILDEFRRPTTLLDETPLSLLAYALEKIGDPGAVPVLTDWLQANLFAELLWAPDFATHTIKVLGRQSGLNTRTYIYGIDEKLDTIAQARVGNTTVQPSLAGTCSVAAADPFGTCPERVIVTGINAAGQQETVSLDYRVSKRDLQDIIDTTADATLRDDLKAKQAGWASVDEQHYGSGDYVPLPGAVISRKSNCAGTVTEHIINSLAAQKGFPVTLPPGCSNAEQIRALALTFGGMVPLSAIDPLTVISHDYEPGDSSKHVEVPIQADASTALVYSKDNYGKLRQHTVKKSSLFSQFSPAQNAYNDRSWYQSGGITTRFYRVDPSRILSITVASSACPCNPAAPDAIPVAFTSPTAPTTDQRVITVSGTVGSPDVSTATLTVNNSPQSVTLSGGAFSSVVVLRSGDNTIKVDVTGPTGRRGCAQTTIKSTTPKTTISVTLTWNLPASDVDLYVTQPDGETSWYSHKTTTIGGRLDVDNTQGFGPENYFLSSEQGNKVLPGVYTIRVHYYRDRQKTEPQPARVVGWRVVILVNEGTPAEKTQIFSGSLSVDSQTNDSPGATGPDWATVQQLTFTP